MIHKMSFRTRRIIIGLLFIAIGIGYLGEHMQWWSFTLFFPGWWSLFLIIPALLSILENGICFMNVCILIFGGYFLAEANDWISFAMTFPIFMAVVCICIGIRLLCKRRVTWYGYKADGYKD